jgi:predicted DNA-binding transcriptional regulator AlpA
MTLIDNPLCTPKDVMAFLGIKRTTYFALKASDPDFPKPARIGGSLRFDASEVRAYWRTKRAKTR